MNQGELLWIGSGGASREVPIRGLAGGPASFQGTLGADLVYQLMRHCLCGQGKEVLPILNRNPYVSETLQVNGMQKVARTQGWRLAFSQDTCRDFPKPLVYQPKG